MQRECIVQSRPCLSRLADCVLLSFSISPNISRNERVLTGPGTIIRRETAGRRTFANLQKSEVSRCC
jgi:hypothetical protein